MYILHSSMAPVGPQGVVVGGVEHRLRSKPRTVGRHRWLPCGRGEAADPRLAGTTVSEG